MCEKHNFELVEADTENHVMLVGADLHLADKQNDLRNFKKRVYRRNAGFCRCQLRAGFLPHGGAT